MYQVSDTHYQIFDSENKALSKMRAMHTMDFNGVGSINAAENACVVSAKLNHIHAVTKKVCSDKSRHKVDRDKNRKESENGLRLCAYNALMNAPQAQGATIRVMVVW